MTRQTLSILIASMGRPSLVRTLHSLADARRPAETDIEVVVADDSPDHAVPALLDGMALPFPVHVVAVGARNVSRARNAAIAAARGEWLAFVDDDEWVDAGWLEGLVSTAADFDADAVFGPVRHIYPETAPAWFTACDPMFLDMGWAQTGREAASGHTANALVRKAALDAHGLRFDEGFGLSGGEDDDLFRRLKATGAKLVVTDRAWVSEAVPEARANPAYIMTRHTRGGQTYAKITLRGASPWRKTAFAADATAKLAIGAVASLALRPFDRAKAFRFAIKQAVNRGKLLALTDAKLLSSWA